MLDRLAEVESRGVDTTTQPVKFRGGGFVPATTRFGGWIAMLVLVIIWQIAGSSGLVNSLFLPAPSAIARAIYELAISGALWQHVSWSLLRIGTGWLLGTVAGLRPDLV
jgi:ABC-type nitrate/sulfonate/bicarbonate transport system permease component